MIDSVVVRNQRHACTRCRTSKVRCLVDTVAEHGKCRRCFEADSECTFELEAPREKRKRTDTRLNLLDDRVSNLEAAIDSVSSAIHGDDNVTSTKTSGKHNKRSSESLLEDELPARETNSSSNVQTISHRQSFNASGPSDLISQYLSTERAVELFTTFKLCALPQYPIISFDDEDNFNDLRNDKPLLVFAVVTAACQARDSTLFNKMHTHLQKLLVEEAVLKGKKNLELLLSILVMEVWYAPPEDFQSLNFFMWIQIAATMALQLGLWWPVTKTDPGNASADTIIDQKSRTAFAVYLSLSTVCISLRLPRMVSCPEQARHSLRQFSSTHAEINDKRLYYWLKLQLIAEEVEALRLRLVAPSICENDIVDLMHTFEVLKLSFIRFENDATGFSTASLKIHYFYCLCKLNEAIMIAYEVGVHKMPVVDDRIPSPLQTNLLGVITREVYVTAMSSLLKSCQDLLNCFMEMDWSLYLHSPTVTTIRALYALEVLFHLSLPKPHQGVSQQHLVQDTLHQCLLYLRRLKQFFEQASPGKTYAIPRMAHQGLEKLSSKLKSHITKMENNQNHREEATDHSGTGASNDFEKVTSPSLSELHANVSTDHNEIAKSDAWQLRNSPTISNSIVGRDNYNKSSSQISVHDSVAEYDDNQMSNIDAMTYPGTSLWDIAEHSSQDLLTYGWFGTDFGSSWTTQFTQ